MNKKIALVTLLRNSLLLSDEEKISLISSVPQLTDTQVDALGKFLAAERNMWLDNEADILAETTSVLTASNPPAPIQPDKIYVGTGKP